MGTIFGYARVSTKDQNSISQEEELHRAGCSRIYRDIASGALTARAGLDQCLKPKNGSYPVRAAAGGGSSPAMAARLSNK